MSDYTTVAKAAARIREALKAKGWTSKDVSIRSESFSMGSAIRCEIKSPRVPLAVVKAIAEDQEHIRRDGWGEILSGGNRYVTIRYSKEALAALGAPHVEAVKAAAAKVHENFLIPVETAPAYLIGACGNGSTTYFRLWSETGYENAESTPEGLAAAIGQRLVEKGA